MNRSTKPKKKFLIKLVAVAKDEGPYIPQWVFHHFNIGIDLIEIHINNTTDNSLAICEKISKSNKCFTYFTSEKLLKKCREDGEGFQIAAYNKSLRRSRRGIDKATHILFLDLDEYLISKDTETKLSQLIGTCPDADVFSFLWYLEYWDENRKPFSNPIIDNRVGIRNPHLKSLVKTSKKIKSCRHHNAVFKDDYTPTNLLSDTLIPLSDTTNTCLNRSLVNNELLNSLSKDTTEGWFILHCVYRSETEYLTSLIRARAHNNHQDPIKDNRWGLINPGGQILHFNANNRRIQYKVEFLLFLTKNRLIRELDIARNFLLDRRKKLDKLISEQPSLLINYYKVFRRTMYDQSPNNSNEKS